MSNSNGIITAPVDLENDVCKVLGLGMYDVGAACTSPNINQWSKKKPIKYNKWGELTEQEWMWGNYGMDIGYAHSLDVVELFKRASNTPDWKYLRPEGTDTSQYRTLDFEGYNHYAVFPFRFSFPSLIYIYGDSGVASQGFVVAKQANADMWITDFRYAMEGYGGYDRFRWAIIWRRQGSTIHSDIHFSYGNYIKDTTETEIIDVNFPSVGYYDTLLVVTNEITESSDAYDSIYIPRSLHSVSIERKYDSVVVTITNASTLQNQLMMSGGQITGFDYVYLSMNVGVGTTSTSGTGRLDLWIRCMNNNNQILAEFQLNPQESGEFYYSGSGVKTTVLDYMTGSIINLRNYVDDYTLAEIRKVEMRPVPEKVRGNCVFYMDKTYAFTVEGYY